MLYRLFVCAVLSFWLGMSFLLLRKEFGWGDGSLREVPVEHVLKLMLFHEQPSDLQIFNGKQTAGRLRVAPHGGRAGDRRAFDFSGLLQMEVPGLPRQQAAWKGAVQLSPQLAVEGAQCTVTLRDPAGYVLDASLDPAIPQLTYEARVDGRLLDHGAIPLTEQGATDWLRNAGVDPALFLNTRHGPARPPVIRALQSSLEVRGEKIDTFAVSVAVGGQTLLEFHIDQLGHVLRVRTFLGYAAAPDEMAP